MNFYSLRTISLLIDCVLLADASIVKNTLESRVPRIVGGHEAQKHSHPYLVSLQLKFLWVRTHICGGSILNQEWILTAAHCVDRSWFMNWLLPIEAIAGVHDVNNFGPEAYITGIKQTISHPLYEGGIGPYDVAVLQTSKLFFYSKFVQPISLPKVTFKVNQNNTLILAGWGALRSTVFIPDMPSRLQEVQVKFMSHDECHEAIEQLLEDNESNPLNKQAHMCTGPISGGKAACSGDSGGPLIQKVPKSDVIPIEAENQTEASNGTKLFKEAASEETPVILGIVSWGFAPCGIEGSPTVYTKVSEYLKFIEYNIQSNKKLLPY